MTRRLQRPDHADVERRVFDERYRVRPEVRRGRLVVAEFRCVRRRHLQGLVVRQPAGLWVAWHPAGLPLDVWAQEWFRLADDEIRIRCSCTVRRVNLRWVV